MFLKEESDKVLEFWDAAYPWILLGLFVAVFCVFLNEKKAVPFLLLPVIEKKEQKDWMKNKFV